MAYPATQGLRLSDVGGEEIGSASIAPRAAPRDLVDALVTNLRHPLSQAGMRCTKVEGTSCTVHGRDVMPAGRAVF